MVSSPQSMKSLRLVFIGIAALAGLLLLVAAVAFNASFQTWAVRRVVAQHPEWGVTIGGVDAGLHRVELTDVRVALERATVTVPRVVAELPVLSAALRDRVRITRLVAKGWSIELAAANAGERVSASPSAEPPGEVVARAFAGMFGLLDLPFDFALDGLEIEGEFASPGNVGRGKVALVGGGLAAGSEGRFELVGDAALADPKFDALSLRGTLAATMDSPRTFTRVTGEFKASVRGAQVPDGITLTADISAARTDDGENFAVAVATSERQLLAVDAALPRRTRQFEGRWRIDVRDADLAPFAFGSDLPEFSVLGEGHFDADAALTSFRGSGRVDAAVDRLAALKPELSAVGAVKVAAEFDFAQRSEVLILEQLNAKVSGASGPIATIESLQPFSVDMRSRKFLAGDAAAELLGVTLHGIPSTWMQPFLDGVTLRGGEIRGELVATTRGGGIHVRSRSPVTISRISLERDGRPWIREVDISLRASADYAPAGWQAEIVELAAATGAGPLLTVAAKAGQLAGDGQPVKTTGRISAQLAALAGQPLARELVAFTSGQGSVDFAASLGRTRELQATVSLRELAANSIVSGAAIPAISTTLRADVSDDGRITLNLPVLLEAGDRKSDVTLAGTVVPEKDAMLIDAQVTSTNLVLDDAKVVAALLANPESAPGVEQENREPEPRWAGVRGKLALALKRVVYSGAVQASDVTGTLRIADGELKLEGMRTGLGEGGRASFDGAVKFEAGAAEPYVVAVELAVNDFDPGPLFRALYPGQEPTLEGSFQVASRLGGRAKQMDALAGRLAGDFQLTSRGGVFRGLPVNVANIAESTGTIAGWIASAGAAISELRGRKEADEITNKAQAVAELAKRLSAMSYDQLNLTITRDASLKGTIKEFTLISPEMRLSGTGSIEPQDGGGLFDQRLTMDFDLRARDRVASLLRRIGKLEETTDELGYAACTLPLKVNGTLGRPQTGELNRALVAIALERSGVTDKATEFVERIFGK